MKNLSVSVPESYRSRTFSGIIGDIKALPSRKALSLISRKKGLGSQYACLYLSHGIDDGKGYQACATEALAYVLGGQCREIIRGSILDVGCAVGVAAGILSLDGVVGFDLFIDLLRAAKLIDTYTNRHNRYVAADMTKEWPFEGFFDTVLCGLVCHHLKTQRETVTFFSNANRVLKPSGTLLITLPSGSIATIRQFTALLNAVERFGFHVDWNLSGIVLSKDNPRSLFWMFLIVAQKTADAVSDVFIGDGFSFSSIKAPVTREEKGNRVKESEMKERRVKHTRFVLLPVRDTEALFSDSMFVYPTIAEIMSKRLP